MNLAFDHRRGAETLPGALDKLVARINVLWAKEHDPDTGKHTNLSISNLTVDNLTVTGNITAGSITAGSITVSGAIQACNLNLICANPYLQWVNTAAPASEQDWVMQAFTSRFDFRTNTGNIMQVTRTGFTPTLVTIYPNLTVNGTLEVISTSIHRGWTVTFDEVTATPIRLHGRVSDGVANLAWYNNSGSTLFYTLWSNTADSLHLAGGTYGLLITGVYIYPTIDIAQFCGHPSLRWNGVHSYWFYAATGGGLAWDNATTYGLVKNASHTLQLLGFPLVSMTGALTVGSTISSKGLYIDAPAAAANAFITFRHTSGSPSFFHIESDLAGALKFRDASNGHVWTLGSGGSLSYFYGSTSQHIGHYNIRYANVYSNSHDAVIGGGYTWNNDPNIGFVFDSSAWIQVRGAMYFAPYIDATSGTSATYLGTAARRWSSVYGNYFDAVTGYVFSNNTGYGLTLSPSGYVELRGFLHFHPAVNGGSNLGHTSYRWNVVYAVNGVINTSDARRKLLKPNPLGLDFLRKVKTFAYRWKNDPTQAHYGVIAQQLKQIGFDGMPVPESDDVDYGLNYSELIAPLIKAVQELDQRVTRAEDHIERRT